MAGAREEGQVKGEAESRHSVRTSAWRRSGRSVRHGRMDEGPCRKVPLHPLMAHPAAAVAAATAIGFGLTSHIAGVMFGAMQGAVEAAAEGLGRAGQMQADTAG